MINFWKGKIYFIAIFIEVVLDPKMFRTFLWSQKDKTLSKYLTLLQEGRGGWGNCPKGNRQRKGADHVWGT